MAAAMPTINPLTPNDCDCLDKALASIAITKELLSRCESCGLDVKPLEAILVDHETKARKLKAEFFPNRP